MGKEKKKINVNQNVQVTKFIGQYIRDHIGANQVHFADPPNHRPLDPRFVGSAAFRLEHARLKKDVLLKCKMSRREDGKLALEYLQAGTTLFTVEAGDVVRCKKRVFGRIIEIRSGVPVAGNDDPRPRPQIHLHIWHHEMDGPLGTHAHPKRLFQTESCRDDVNYFDVLEKLDVVDGHVTPTGHPRLRAENSYICSHRLIFATNSFVAIPVEIGCPGCRKREEEKPVYSPGEFVVYRTERHDPKEPNDIGLIRASGEDRYSVMPLSRWDDFVSQEGIRDSMVFRKDEKLWYASRTATTISISRILSKVSVIGLSRVAEVGEAVRGALETPSPLSDFWLGKREIDESEDLFCLIDGPINLSYLYQNETKRRNWAGRTDWLNTMRRDIPTSPLPSVAHSRLKVQQLGKQTAILDCCAGIGGFSMGVVAATGASVPLAVENDADIGSLYAKLHPESTVVSEGAAYAAKNWQVLKRRLHLETKKWVILQAGVPCQPFSKLNRCPKPDDPRIGVIFEVLSLLQVSGATHLLIECVDGMIHHQNTHVEDGDGDVLKLALRALTDLGYAFSVNVHQAAAYGTPQSRKRLFVWAAKLGTPLPTPPAPTHHAGAGAPSVSKFGSFQLQPVSREGPLRYLKQVDAVSDLPEILSAKQEAFDGQSRAQFYGFWEGAKSYNSAPLTNFQLRLRNYDLGGRVMLQYCHIPTENTYRKMLTEVDSEPRRILPGSFPCVTTGALGAHPTQQRSFSPRERLRAQGFPDYINLRFGELKKEDLYKESDFICLLSGNAVPVPLSTAHGRAFVKAMI